MPENVLDQLCEMFRAGNAQFRVLHHEAAGKTSQSVAEIRGTELGQGAKALCCTVKGNGIKCHVLAVLPADKQADLSQLAAAFGGRRASLASPDEVRELTGCVFGAVPPVRASMSPAARSVTVCTPTCVSWPTLRSMNATTNSPSTPAPSTRRSSSAPRTTAASWRPNPSLS